MGVENLDIDVEACSCGCEWHISRCCHLISYLGPGVLSSPVNSGVEGPCMSFSVDSIRPLRPQRIMCEAYAR